MKRVKGNMDDRQKAFDEHLKQMKKELEGAEAAAAKKIAEVEANCDALNHKFKVSVSSSKSICACNWAGLLAVLTSSIPGYMMATGESRYGIDG